jgi:hypothetical protein
VIDATITMQGRCMGIVEADGNSNHEAAQ